MGVCSLFITKYSERAVARNSNHNRRLSRNIRPKNMSIWHKFDFRAIYFVQRKYRNCFTT